MEALATELGALTPEQAAAPVNTVEVSGGLGRAAAGTDWPAGRWGRGDTRRALQEGGLGWGEVEGDHLSARMRRVPHLPAQVGGGGGL